MPRSWIRARRSGSAAARSLTPAVATLSLAADDDFFSTASHGAHRGSDEGRQQGLLGYSQRTGDTPCPLGDQWLLRSIVRMNTTGWASPGSPGATSSHRSVPTGATASCHTHVWRLSQQREPDARPLRACPTGSVRAGSSSRLRRTVRGQERPLGRSAVPAPDSEPSLDARGAPLWQQWLLVACVWGGIMLFMRTLNLATNFAIEAESSPSSPPPTGCSTGRCSSACSSFPRR